MQTGGQNFAVTGVSGLAGQVLENGDRWRPADGPDGLKAWAIPVTGGCHPRAPPRVEPQSNNASMVVLRCMTGVAVELSDRSAAAGRRAFPNRR